jgi:hypothetical protein
MAWMASWRSSPSSINRSRVAGTDVASPSATWFSTTYAIRFMSPARGSAAIKLSTISEQGLKPTLKRGDIVIIDNLPAHKGVAVEKVINTARARLLYLPKYSPDLTN